MQPRTAPIQMGWFLNFIVHPHRSDNLLSDSKRSHTPFVKWILITGSWFFSGIFIISNFLTACIFVSPKKRNVLLLGVLCKNKFALIELIVHIKAIFFPEYFPTHLNKYLPVVVVINAIVVAVVVESMLWLQ